MKYVNKYLRNLAPYKVASHRIWEVPRDERSVMLKLDWNEATIPPSPKVKERLLQLVMDEDVYKLYPSTHNDELLQLLSSYAGLPEENLQYFASSDSLHEYLVRMYVSVGDPILIIGPTYDNFRLTCESQGAKVEYFNYTKDFELDIQSLINYIRDHHPSLVYICNPNNPTGNLLSQDDLKILFEKYPDTVFLMDEAYYEFSRESSSDLVLDYSNIFISRTFSKAFALANFRAGYLISDRENILQISKIRNPKNFTSFAQEAVIGVLSDIDYMNDYVNEVNEAKDWFSESIVSMPFIKSVHESRANFVLIEFASNKTKQEVFHYLAENNVFVRNLTHSELLADMLRITIGTRKQMERVHELFSSYL